MQRRTAAHKPHRTIAPRPTGSAELVSCGFPSFHARHDARIANPAQQSTIIEIRPYRRGWRPFEEPGVELYWTERVNGRSPRAWEVSSGMLALARRDRCLDCSVQSFRVHRFNQMFGETSRETFLYISHSTEAADCD